MCIKYFFQFNIKIHKKIEENGNTYMLKYLYNECDYMIRQTFTKITTKMDAWIYCEDEENVLEHIKLVILLHFDFKYITPIGFVLNGYCQTTAACSTTS